jgi:hypothetical protein
MTFAQNRHADRPAVALPAFWFEVVDLPTAGELQTAEPALLLVHREMGKGVTAGRQLDAAMVVHDVKNALRLLASGTSSASSTSPTRPSPGEAGRMTRKLVPLVALLVEVSALLGLVLAMS